MRIVQSCWILLLLSGLVACGSHDASHGDDHGAADHEASDRQDHGDAAAHDGGDHGLALNGDEKWEMDEHTRTVFAKMAGRLNGSSVDDAATAPDAWKQTGNALKQDISELIAGCTMQGPAHDELHKFLTAYIPAVNELATSGAAKSASEVHELLEVYPDYFE